MEERDIDKRFKEIVAPIAPTKQRREPAKFPELRYLYGVTALGTFVIAFFVGLIESILK